MEYPMEAKETAKRLQKPYSQNRTRGGREFLLLRGRKVYHLFRMADIQDMRMKKKLYIYINIKEEKILDVLTTSF
jgi:hypothetical protein